MTPLDAPKDYAESPRQMEQKAEENEQSQFLMHQQQEDEVQSVAPYERMNSFSQPQVEEEDENAQSSNQVLFNFIIMSILFSANHGAMVSCLAFSTLQLGSTGAWELSLFHFIYALSSLLGATFMVKQLGSRNSMLVGMGLYASYVAFFWLALRVGAFINVFAILGAFLGGIGGGFVWTAQGTYFSRSAEDYSACSGSNKPPQEATSYLAGIFAFIYLAEEVACKMLSWILLEETSATWTTVIAVYAAIAIASTLLMVIVHEYPIAQAEMETSMWYKATAAWQLLWSNPKMKYLAGLNAVFGLACPFVNAYVNGEVVYRVVGSSRFVGLFSALSSAVAAICSLAFGSSFLAGHKGLVLILGSISFALVVIPFILQPDLTQWTVIMLSAIYCFQGMGRSTFEGALRSIFADYFPVETEGSYANIILQNGGFTSLGFLLSFYVPCNDSSFRYCVEFKEGGYHNMLVLELGVVIAVIVSIAGFLRAQTLHQQEEMSDDTSREGRRQAFLMDDASSYTSSSEVASHFLQQRSVAEIAPLL